MPIPNKLKRLVAALLLVAVPALSGCPALLVVYLVSASDGDNVTVTAEIPRNANEIYETAMKIAEEDGGQKYTVVEADPARTFLRAEALDQSWWFEMTLVQLDENNTQLIMVGVSPGDEEEQRNRGLIAVERICDDLGVRYKVVENNAPAN
ncbi:MAG: hypothetical protein AB7E51_01455 [Pseudodesulfovibrio sp.]|uniref:Uncharacterized protein n=1 Tax=Pseudodesulfovibrio indicus TaxID=1716143 RepID=A0A126QQT7_9BACT|nr:hypothetical protein [Pseudodesulfovibrio indicus]AMK12423.1 hypothetical protein AWY79_15600 [Pseudodesulfovibrio indicus]TDT90723.1 hypothetical protein EDC59_102153 [Pseudodesulfovibrio indicus]